MLIEKKHSDDDVSDHVYHVFQQLESEFPSPIPFFDVDFDVEFGISSFGFLPHFSCPIFLSKLIMLKHVPKSIHKYHLCVLGCVSVSM